MEDPSIDIIFNIAATPKGVAIKSPTITFRGEEARFAHLIPSLWYRTPQGGSMFNNRVNAHEKCRLEGFCYLCPKTKDYRQQGYSRQCIPM